jgi:hypothetical protein
MWHTILLVNSVLMSLVSVYLIYTFGAMILLGEWKTFLLVLMLWIFLGFAEVALGAIAEP